jgi:hypothetical protein
MRSAIQQDPEFQFLHKALNKPNLFNVLDNLSYEIRHSNFLAWILDPHGSHKQDDLFLKRFLNSIYETTEVGEVFEIRREQDRIDILIRSQYRVIVIENKTFTTDSTNQLNRYRTLIQAKYSKLKQRYIYWTPGGDQPTDKGEQIFWSTYSYDLFVSNFEPLLNNITDHRVAIYLDDYIESLKINTLSNSVYVDSAKSLIDRHKDYIGKIFAEADKLDSLSKITFKFIEKHSFYQRGNGFFSINKHYRAAFESACKSFQYNLTRSGNSQSTYFGFLPAELTAAIKAEEVCFEYCFRFIEKTNHLRLAFIITPETIHNRRVRHILQNNLKLYHALKLSAPTKSTGKNHIGVVHNNIPFNPLEVNHSKITEHIHDLFRRRVCDAVEAINRVTCTLISES